MHRSLTTAYAKAARDFFVAASHLLNYRSESPLPTLFLLARSIELSLKTLLLESGLSAIELSRKPFRHDLVATFNEVLKRNLLADNVVDQNEVGALDLLSKEYSATRLGYADFERPYYIPRIDLAESVANKLLSACTALE